MTRPSSKYSEAMAGACFGILSFLALLGGCYAVWVGK